MLFTTQCPQCGKILSFSDKLAGTQSICPACGGKVFLNAPPTAPDAPAVSPGAAETVPPAVEESLLTHQAAAAAGEAHVDYEESDVVPWAQPEAAPAAKVEPPVWAPPPLSGVEPAAAPREEGAWFTPRAAGQIVSLRRTGGEEEIFRRTPLIMGAAIVVAAILVGGLLYYLTQARSASDWEVANRAQLLSLKQEAEMLAAQGQRSEALAKYQELERDRSGHDIVDPDLRSEMEQASQAQQYLVNQLAGGAALSVPETQPAATEPGAPVASPETQPSEPVTLPSPPASTAPADSAAPPPVTSPRPAVRATPRQISGLTDEQIGASITHGVDFLISQFDGHEIRRTAESDDYHDGLDSLAVYALMQSGLATSDPRLDEHGEFMSGLIETMKKLTMEDSKQTYGRSIRTTALSLYNRREDRRAIQLDVEWLLHAQRGGAFTYSDQFARNSDLFFWDNSNSQYGLLGVWSAAEIGMSVPTHFWRDVQQHWTDCQLADGQWPYTGDKPSPRRSMTLAGIASLFVTQDYLDAEDWGDRVGRPPFSPALSKALDWLETADNSVITHDNEEDWAYTLYGLERAGLASGFKYFGTHDWYRERAADLIAQQNTDGSWVATYGPVVDTSFALLFLSRGRHPLIMNKLRFSGDWANRPRDAANLARFAGDELERPLNWQVVPLNHDWHDWTDSPILYMASHRPPDLSDDDRAKIKQYILNGGMLLTQADAGSSEFTDFVMDLGRRLFPQYQWTDLPADSPLWTIEYRIASPPKIKVITNGSRILMMHWPDDITHLWQNQPDDEEQSALELGVNVVLYAAGRSELKNRVQSEAPVAAAAPAAASIRVARVRYDGNWDPEPDAWPRAQEWFREQTSLDLTLEPTDAQDLASSNPPLAHLTGTAAFKPTDTQLASIKSYVENGGVLVIDPCGVPGDFLHSITDDVLLRAFPNSQLEPIDPAHPLLTRSADGMEDITAPRLRQFVRVYSETLDGRPMMLRAGKGHVIVLPLDLTSGLLDVSTWGIAGYRPGYALSLMKNIVLWTWDGAKDGA
ncbi:MAG: DUF4159 domain-containing protein [Tepidisphaeraceae bacterium]|jgi:DNA-directed RNA polymerase subunit RPC12/RpoP